MEENSQFICESCGEFVDEYWYCEVRDIDVCEDCKSDTECRFCGNEIEEGARYCSYECSKADNTEGV